jgi:hypothetical protein
MDRNHKLLGEIACDHPIQDRDSFSEAASGCQPATIDDQREGKYAYENQPFPLLPPVRFVLCPAKRNHSIRAI